MKTFDEAAEELFKAGDFRGALVRFKSIVEDDPKNAVAYQRIAECYYRLGNREEAARAAYKAIEIDPRLVIPHTILAFIHYWNGKHEQGVAEALLAYKLSPESVEALDCYGTILLAQGKLKEGISLLEKARELEPERLSVRNNLAVAYRGTKNYRQYLQEAQYVFKKRPSIKSGARLLEAYQHKYAIPLSILIAFVPVLALITRNKLLLLIPAYPTVGGLFISYRLFRNHQPRAALTHFIAYALYATILGVIYSQI